MGRDKKIKSIKEIINKLKLENPAMVLLSEMGWRVDVDNSVVGRQRN